MQEYYLLHPDTASLYNELDESVFDKDLTVKTDQGESLYLTNVFKGGYAIGFWSHSPWGCVRDQEQGWVLVDSKGKELTRCATRVNGENPNEGYRDWRRKITMTYGKSKKLCPEWENACCWKLNY